MTGNLPNGSRTHQSISRRPNQRSASRGPALTAASGRRRCAAFCATTSAAGTASLATTTKFTGDRRTRLLRVLVPAGRAVHDAGRDGRLECRELPVHLAMVRLGPADVRRGRASMGQRLARASSCSSSIVYGEPGGGSDRAFSIAAAISLSLCQLVERLGWGVRRRRRAWLTSSAFEARALLFAVHGCLWL